MSSSARMLICLVALAVAGFLWWRKKGQKAHAVSMFLAVGGLIGGALGGWLTRIAVWAAGWIVTGEHKLVVLAFGGSDPGLVLTVIALAAIGIVIHDLWPKNSARRVTVIIAGLAPILMLAAGGQLASAGQGSFALSGHASVVQAGPPATVQTLSNPQHPGV